MCPAKVCSGCGELEEEDHECNLEIQASFRLIKQESKPCPVCGAPIIKISGCNHMFCTDCKTAFDWMTMKIHAEGNSNPHYYEWLRTRTTYTAQSQSLSREREFRDKVNLLLSRYISPEYGPSSWIGDLLRRLPHMQDHDVLYYREISNDMGRFNTLRIEYILKDINEQQWKVQIQRIDKKQKNAKYIADVLELFTHSALDILKRNMIYHRDQSSIRQEIDVLLKLCNAKLERAHEIFGTTIFQITEDFKFKKLVVKCRIPSIPEEETEG